MNMAGPQAKSPPRKKTKISRCFTACFGFSDDKERPLKLTPQEECDNHNVGYCASWSNLRIKRSSTMTAQATDVESEKAEAQRRYDNKKKVPQKFHDLIRSKIPKQQPIMRHRNSFIPPPITSSAFSDDQVTSMEKVVQNPKSETYVDPSPEITTCLVYKDLPFCRKIDDIRAGAGVSSTLPNSPLDRTKPAGITQSSSFPPLHRETIRLRALAVPSRTIHKKSSTRKTRADAAKKLDPALGLSVLLVTMVTMILWGRLCAILCTSALFYFTSKFRSTAGPADDWKPTPVPLPLDLDSEEHKKKVVLEGFLERKRR